MINRRQLNDLLVAEKELYLGDNKNKIKQMKRSCHKRYLIFMYLYYFRCCQYYRDLRISKDSSKLEKKLAKYKYRYYEKKKNIFSYKSGVEIGIDSKVGKCCDIWHSGVVINGNVGDNCVFHGNNTIGNKGVHGSDRRPVIGDNVDIGVGAIVIGDIDIADNSIIGAGSVVTKSFTDENSIIVGVPGKKIN